MNSGPAKIEPERIRQTVEDFVHRMVKDPMIGFFFWNVDVPTLVQREFELSARFVGWDVPYTGRPIGKVHQAHRIMGGQFDRRRQILQETLDDHQIPPDVQATWLHHVDTMRSRITADSPGVCTAPDLPEDEGRPVKGPPPLGPTFRIVD
ncbi:MAG TPA: hypothetical protein RMG48_02370 [Myxococcales bacterium LLY-WYZ-16_1]|nr:hypothetical protein [Myxococcales bacterium LLY-WYZ-16_1]